MFIFSNLATSLDGKIATADRGMFHLGSAADKRRMQTLRRRADAVLVGASTLRCYRRPMGVPGARRQPLNVILSSTLAGISPDWPFFQAPGISRVLIVGPRTPAATIRRFASVAEIVQLRAGGNVARQAVRALAKRKVRRLLVEGGGSTIWEFVSAGLIDEFHVTLTPWILGGAAAPTLVDGAGFPGRRALRLRRVASRAVEDELFLTFRRV